MLAASGATIDADCASKKSSVLKEPDPEIGEMSHSSAIAVNVNANQSDNGSDDGEWELNAPYPMSSNVFNATLSTFGDVIEAVHVHTAKMEDDEECNKTAGRADRLKLLSLKASMDSPDDIDARPCFALRTLVKERLAAIIANDIAGSQSIVDIQQDNTLSVTLGRAKATAEKWFIPRRERKAFRVVAFEAIFFWWASTHY
jgi:hypothetical protein